MSTLKQSRRIQMESKKLAFANNLNLGVDWQEEGDKVFATFSNSNDFSDVCAKLDKSSAVEDIDEEGDINLFGASFSWNGYSDDETVYHISAIGDFSTDEYKVEIQ